MSVLRTELQARQETARLNKDAHLTLAKRGVSDGRIVLHEDAFVAMLYLERRRAGRAQKRFLLMLIDIKGAIADGQKNGTLGNVDGELLSETRETDIVGWYLEDHLMGVIYTKVGKAKSKPVQGILLDKV